MENFKIYDRELSWLSFNYRVLQEAKDASVPLYERIKFLAIFSSNLDEFFRVRVASLRSLLDLKKKSQHKLKFDPQELLKKIRKTVNNQQEEFGEIFRNQILPGLNKNNIYLINEHGLSENHKTFINEYFREQIQPLVQPILISPIQSGLFLQNRAIYLAVKLQPIIKKNGKENNNKKYIRYKYALIEIPSDKLPRFIILPEENQKKYVIFLDDLIRLSLPYIFPGYNVVESYSIKLTRDAELYIDDEFSGNLLEKIKKSLSKRKSGIPCRFLYDSDMPKDFLKILIPLGALSKDDLIRGGRYHNFNDFFSFPNLGSEELEYEPMPYLKYKELENSGSLFDVISVKDIMIHYPYQSYNYVIKFLEEAAADESAKSIQITLYRTALNSKIIRALIDASKNGKLVTAFIEVKARFDEESNFQNAEELENAGAKVLYSFPGLKVHSKICLISRGELGEEKYFAYLSTGNFNEKTAKVYSDIGFFTADDRIVNELKKIFNILSKKSEKEIFNNLLVAPFNLRDCFIELINNEIRNAQEGKKAFIILKLNSLEDNKMIKKLYEASNEGVKIRIIVRGICSLVPGIKNMSSNIKVISIVDRYLEHTRIYNFYNGGEEKYFISSADWMRRNLNRRIELCFPVYDESIKNELKKFLRIQLSDNVKARRINRTQNNPYRISKSENNTSLPGKQVRAQYAWYDYLERKNKEEVMKLENNLPLEVM